MNEDLKRIFIDTITTYNFSDQEVEDTKIKEFLWLLDKRKINKKIVKWEH